MPMPRGWVDQVEAGRRIERRRKARRDVELTGVELDAEPDCPDCDGVGVTPAGDVCGCVDW